MNQSTEKLKVFKYPQSVSRGTMKVTLNVDISSFYPLLTVNLLHIYTYNTFTCILGTNKHFSRLWKIQNRPSQTLAEPCLPAVEALKHLFPRFPTNYLNATHYRTNNEHGMQHPHLFFPGKLFHHLKRQ